MNAWLLAALVLIVAGVVPLAAVAVFADVVSGAVAFTLGGPVTSLVLLLLAQGYGRQPFVDLAVALALMSFCGSFILARFLEWNA